jgi:hypothetical protein
MSSSNIFKNNDRNRFRDGDRSFNDRGNDRSYNDRSNGDRSYNDRGSDRSNGDRSNGDRGSDRNNRSLYSQQRNQFSGTRIQQQVAAPLPQLPVPPIEEFPALLCYPKTVKIATTATTATTAIATTQYSQVAKDVPVVAVQAPKNKKSKLRIIEPPLVETVVYKERTNVIRMTLDECRQLKEEGEDIDLDNVSICSEYSNHADDESDDDI